jgi:hypothetical protein
MLRWMLAFAAIATVSGCANIQPMALKTGQDRIDTDTNSVVLLTLEVLRLDGSRYQPSPTLLLVSEPGTRPRDQARLFQLASRHDASEASGHAVYYASMALPAGTYRIDGISGIANAFPFVGRFFIPLLTDFEVTPRSVIYLGHVGATLRERGEGEFRAGPVIPLIDQAATGMIGHTWDVEIADRYDVDMAVFRDRVPALGNLAVENRPLPAWSREAAQRLWGG